MKMLEYIDPDGRKHKTMVRDDDYDASIGVPLLTVDVDQLNWPDVATNLHNQLIQRGLYSLSDIQTNQQEFINAIVTALKKPLSQLYQEANQ